MCDAHDKTAAPVLVDTSRSRFAKLQPVPITAVTLQSKFWLERQRINQDVMIPAQFALCERTGRIGNFKRASGKLEGGFEGAYYNDSDVYKLLEAAIWSLASRPNADLEAKIDALIQDIADAQQPDGYLNTYFILGRENERWTNFDMHEMYCAGHLMQAAVAHVRVTGKKTLLDVATRFADHIYSLFGREEDGKRFGADGHPEVEMALVELYRATGERRYLELSQYFVDVRGKGLINDGPYGRFPISYHQDHVPLREMTRLDGHAVRAVYLNCGVADIIAEDDDAELKNALETMWQQMVSRQMYVHGGLGPRYSNEGFGEDYELPNSTAHAETCASVSNLMWNWRMLLLDADRRYADLAELCLYNSILSGVSLDGAGYYYQNPLRDNGNHRRQEWFGTACCPGNVSRTIAMLQGYLYTTSENAVWVHLYTANTATIAVSDALSVTLAQRTDYPWSGDIEIEAQTAGRYTLHLRIPAWADGAWTLTINGESADYALASNGYVAIDREWAAGDVIGLQLPMPTRFVESHPAVAENHARVAVMRGPVLYCIEGTDHPDLDLDMLTLKPADAFTPEYKGDMLAGVTVLNGKATISEWDDGWQDALYLPEREDAVQRVAREVPVMMIPYYAWANRTPDPMRVWMRAR